MLVIPSARRCARGTAHIVMSAIVMAVGQAARAGDIQYHIVTYSLSQSDVDLGGTVRLSGTLITDGTMGELSSSDVIGGSLTYVDGADNVHILPFSSVTDPYDFTFGDVGFHVPFLVATAENLSVPLGGGGTIAFGFPHLPLPFAEMQYSNEVAETDGVVTYTGAYSPDSTSPADSYFTDSADRNNTDAGAGSIFGSNSWVIADAGAAVPEPSSIALGLLAFGALLLLARRKKRACRV